MAEQHPPNLSSIYPWATCQLEAAYRPFGPPGRRGHEALDGTASYRHEQSRLRTQPDIAEQVNRTGDLGTARFAYNGTGLHLVSTGFKLTEWLGSYQLIECLAPEREIRT